MSWLFFHWFFWVDCTCIWTRKDLFPYQRVWVFPSELTANRCSRRVSLVLDWSCCEDCQNVLGRRWWFHFIFLSTFYRVHGTRIWYCWWFLMLFPVLGCSCHWFFSVRVTSGQFCRWWWTYFHSNDLSRFQLTWVDLWCHVRNVSSRKRCIWHRAFRLDTLNKDKQFRSSYDICIAFSGVLYCWN